MIKRRKSAYEKWDTNLDTKNTGDDTDIFGFNFKKNKKSLDF